MSTAQRWILGLDLRGRSQGAVAFARWLREAGAQVQRVHVLGTWMRGYLRADNYEQLRGALARASAALGPTSTDEIQVVEAERAELGLARATEGAAGLIVGRAAPAAGQSWVRLGRTARRVLRDLPVPVIVVPPDWRAAGAGPVLVATDLEDTSADAVTFAQALAAQHGRPIELVHVGEAIHNDLIDELEPRWLAAREIYRADVADAVHEWASERGLGKVTRHVVYGDPPQQIAAVAAAREAAVVVVGSRRLGAVARTFLSSTASTLASFAACPVAVVPSRGTAR